VAYVGAYKAILDNYSQEEIKTIIGSSAGGIIGLAVCCKISPDGIIKLCSKYLSKVTDDKTYP
jgi:predicted acylesterase/phospholipase RssA